MYGSRTFAVATLSKPPTTQVLRALNGKITPTSARPGLICIQQHWVMPQSRRQFSTGKPALIKEFFPVAETGKVRKTEPAWPHPVYTQEQMEAIKIAHREAKTFSDKFALNLVRFLRYMMDLATGYKHDPELAKGNKDPKTGRPVSQMTERNWLVRFIFLESVAGVPGMVAGMLRHLRSMRRMKRDNGWIETLLEESFNERMHLLTFLKMAEPGWLMKVLVIGAQGVFFNSLFISYLVSPKTVHRLVGYIEEEAVITYTRVIEDIDAGKLPMFEKMPAPDIAVQYWKMPEGHRSMRDLLLYIRADEAKHREVNHTLGNLNQDNDPNPFVSSYKDNSKPHPCKDITFQKPTGWEREECI